MPQRPAPVLSRLQGLFPPTLPAEKALPPIPTPPLKVRIITWNMHDSVPKGDLEELLGKVPPYTNSPNSETLPSFAAEAGHPYHLIVVAGQECPSLSGIPMGLGAGFKLLDKDKSQSQDPTTDKPRSRPSLREPTHPSYHHSHSSSPYPHSHSHHDHTGWTSLLCLLLCTPPSLHPPSIPSPTNISLPKPLIARPPPPERTGPYALVCKERMMGLYLAVFVHRAALPLLRGTSKDAVAAGLIGGRVGNKGGVGVTLDIAGTTFLFLNAHLAAHEGKVFHRLNNLAKIKSELSVDAFLPPSDPRLMNEDITDKFDYTFLCGDLNFRLDISRLHADWLMARKEYTSALAFDELSKLLASDAFGGFREAPIAFAPTFKYDVPRAHKRRHRHKHSAPTVPPTIAPSIVPTTVPTTNTTSTTTTNTNATTEDPEEERDKEGDETEGEANEASSLASSLWTRGTTGTEDDEDEPFLPPTPRRISVSAVAHKAKAKWLALLSKSKSSYSSSPSPRKKGVKGKAHSALDVSKLGMLTPVVTPERPASTIPSPTPHPSPDKPTLHTPVPPLILVNSTPTPPSPSSTSGATGIYAYDSSAKKRVPSWCDRILWKSTVIPDPEPEPEPEIEERPRTRVGQFFVNAFRPRGRRDSMASNSNSGVSGEEAHDREPVVTHPSQTGPDAPTPPVRPTSPARHHTHPGPLPVPPHEPQHQHRRMTNPNPPVLPPLNLPPPVTVPVPTPRWRFFPSFFHSSSASIELEAPPPALPPPPPPPRKGDVVCLGYGTLDDEGMRRLEGRSDHRPVIGEFAVYI